MKIINTFFFTTLLFLYIHKNVDNKKENCTFFPSFVNWIFFFPIEAIDGFSAINKKIGIIFVYPSNGGWKLVTFLQGFSQIFNNDDNGGISTYEGTTTYKETWNIYNFLIHSLYIHIL